MKFPVTLFMSLAVPFLSAFALAQAGSPHGEAGKSGDATSAGLTAGKSGIRSAAGPRESFEKDLAGAALERTRHRVRYDGAYIAIAYPNGDVPAEIGVCTDVVIRSYRALGTDLQVLVHEDMADNFSAYPSKRIWGLSGADRNIDHRRVPNLQTFFTRHGTELVVTDNGDDYKPGDIVTWMLPGNLPHIGIVTDRRSNETGNPMVVHNIGAGPELEDMLFDYEITGHYRYLPENYRTEGR